MYLNIYFVSLSHIHFWPIFHWFKRAVSPLATMILSRLNNKFVLMWRHNEIGQLCWLKWFISTILREKIIVLKAQLLYLPFLDQADNFKDNCWTTRIFHRRIFGSLCCSRLMWFTVRKAHTNGVLRKPSAKDANFLVQFFCLSFPCQNFVCAPCFSNFWFNCHYLHRHASSS